jgi:hypothetical protein
LRSALLAIASLPFLYFAVRDLAFHWTGRRPGGVESAIHVLLGVAQGAFAAGAWRADARRMAAASLAVVLLGGMDEYAFHRDLPAAEADLHAKSHFAFFAFAAVAAALALTGGGS